MRIASSTPASVLVAIISGWSITSVADTHTTVSQTPSTVSAISRISAMETQAAQWGLEISEYQTFLDLMSGPLGKWNPAIDPLMALGMFADSKASEKHWAQRYAQQEFEMTERVLKFQSAYREAFQRLYPDVGLFDQRLLAPYYTHQQQSYQSSQRKRLAQRRFMAGDRLMLFTRRSCEDCRSMVRQLMGLLSGVGDSGVDIYLRGASDDAAVSEWVNTHQIQEKWLKGMKLTVNRDEGLFQRLASRSTGAEDEIPVFLRRDGRFFRLKAQDLGL